MLKLKEYAGINVYPGYEHNVMGSVGDASFIGPEGQRKGAARKPVYKTPKSSIHYKKGPFPRSADYENENDWETEEFLSYTGDRSTPKNSVHHQDNTNEDFGLDIGADGTIDGGPREMDPVVGKKNKRKSNTKKYGYPSDEIEIDEIKDYDDEVVPSSSIHYGERDRVKGRPTMKDQPKMKGQPKMKFPGNSKNEDITERFKIGLRNNFNHVSDLLDEFEPSYFYENDEENSLWNSNMNKAVIDMSSNKPFTDPESDTPPFPYKNDALISDDETPEFPYKSDAETSPDVTPPLPSTEANIPCDRKDLIQLLLLHMKSITDSEECCLDGNKEFKLNRVYNGNKRKFKSYVKNKKNDIIKVNFGPTFEGKCEK